MRPAACSLLFVPACASTGAATSREDSGADTTTTTDAPSLDVSIDGTTHDASDASVDADGRYDVDAETTASTGATYEGCAVFPADDVYNRDVSGDPVDPNSADYIASASSVDTYPFYASTGVEFVNLADASTPTLTVKQKVPYHSFVPVPWEPSYRVEPLADGHAIVLDTSACRLYELYQATYDATTGVLSAYSGADWDLALPFLTKRFAPSAMASGLSLFSGLVKYEELAGGVHHALVVALTKSSLCNCRTSPADDTDGWPYTGPATSYELPYGAHLRLKASFDDAKFGPQSKAITTALKTYGAFVADVGTSDNAVYTAVPKSGDASLWSATDLAALGAMHLVDFDVLPVGATAPPP